jgi:opacity protein-like surface antigen
MYNDLTFGYQAGIGVDIVKKVTVDLRYEGSLQKYQTKIDAGGENSPWRTGQMHSCSA